MKGARNHRTLQKLRWHHSATTRHRQPNFPTLIPTEDPPPPNFSATQTSPNQYSNPTSISPATPQPMPPPPTYPRSNPSSPPPPPALSPVSYVLNASNLLIPPGPAPPSASQSSISSAFKAGPVKLPISPPHAPSLASPFPRIKPPKHPSGIVRNVGWNIPKASSLKPIYASVANWRILPVMILGFYLIHVVKFVVDL